MLTNKHKLAFAGLALGAGAAFVATQMTGAAFDFDPRLGGWPLPLPAPFNKASIYQPLDIYRWALMAEAMPAALVTGLWSTTACVAASAASAAYLLREAYRGAFKKKKFGEDAWGTRNDAVKAGLIAGEGPAKGHHNSPFSFVIGEAFGTTLTVTDDRFMGIFIGTGGGKSRLLSRSLFTWKSSAFIFLAGATSDIWAYTSGYRSEFSNVIFLDLGNQDGYRYNPLTEIRKGSDFEWDDCRLIANRLPIQSAQKARIPYWVTSPTKIIAAVIRYVIHVSAPGERTMATVRDLCATPPPALAKLLRASPHKNVVDMGNQIANSDPQKMQELLNSVLDYMAPWESEIIRKVTSESDFSMNDLMAGLPGAEDRPVSLYIRIPDDMTADWYTIVKVLFAQARKSILHHEDHMPDGREKAHELAFIMDEFASVNDDDVPTDFSKMRKYGAHVAIATQSPKSLEGIYGENQTILENLRVQIYGASGDAKTQKQIAESIGEAMEVRQSTSSTSDFLNPLPKARGNLQSEQVRKLMNSGEIRSLDFNELIVLPTGFKPFRVKKMMDFTEREPWKSFIKPPAPTVPPKPRDPSSVSGAFI